MSREEAIVIAERWIDAINRHNASDVAALYAEDAVHESPKLYAQRPGTRGLVQGRDALTEWFEASFRRHPTLHYEKKRITADAERAFLEYRRLANGERPLHVAEVFEIHNGLIIHSAVYHGIEE